MAKKTKTVEEQAAAPKCPTLVLRADEPADVRSVVELYKRGLVPEALVREFELWGRG